MGENFDPVLFSISPRGMLSQEYLLTKVVKGREQEAIAFLEALHNEIAMGQFTYSFLEDDYRLLYAEDKKVAAIYLIFTLIAIVVSMLGLFSMSLFDVQQRYNEIAIRKVNGASTGNIIMLLFRKYAILLGVAFLIATPLARLALGKYLETYAFKTPAHWWLFAAALILTGLISLLTLIFQTRKAAETNPASVIRNE